MANLEGDGEGGKFLQIRLLIDITKPLPRCCKLWSEGEHVGWALLKFERFPNFCYWCGRVTHNERDCEVWLRGKGNLKKEEQQYGDWLRAKLVRNTKKKKKKTVVVVFGSSCGKPLWKKGPAMEKNQPIPKDLSSQGAHGSNFGKGGVENSSQTEVMSMEAEPSGVIVSNLDVLHGNEFSDIGGNSVDLNNSMENLVGQPHYTIPMQKALCTEGGVGHSEGLHGIFSFSAKQSPLADITNRAATEPLKSFKQKWSRLLCEVGETDSSSDMEILE